MKKREEERTCLHCGKKIFGRADKKFCDDACRNEFNNLQNGQVNNLMKRINHTLKKNRRILSQLNPAGKAKVTRNQLVRAGFDFKYFTHTYTTKTGSVYYFCYEQAYLPIENNFFALVVDSDYKDKI